VGYYRTGGVGKGLGPGQRRFETTSPEAYWKAVDSITTLLTPHQTIGAVVHSIRAADLAEFKAVHAEAMRRGMPFHMHVEEQRQEVEECLAAYGKTPMRTVLDTVGRAEHITAVHCTHTRTDDRAAFLEAGGRICLCPLTEANLGDGIADLEHTALDRIELVGLGEDRALAVVVTDTGWVTARAITPIPRPSVEELREVGRTLTRRYRGKTFQTILDDIEQPTDPLDPLWTRSRGVINQIVGLLRDRNLYISGAINVLDHPDFSDVATMRGLLKAFEDKARLVDLLTRMADERGVQVLIGGENPVQEMRECSLITSTYTYRGQVLGVLGVVGPRRMAYGDVISIVDETARLVSDSLSRVQRELYLPS